MDQDGALLLAAIVIGLLFDSCNKSEELIVAPPTVTNLITNSSFESNGNPSLQGWDTQGSYIFPAKDAPQGGGTWSIAILGSGQLPVFYIRFTTAGPSGTHVYKFSVWAKCILEGGFADISIKRPDTLITLKSVGIADTSWTPYTFLDTLTTSAGDSLRVHLSGAFSFGGPSSKTFFDLCKLEVLNDAHTKEVY